MFRASLLPLSFRLLRGLLGYRSVGLGNGKKKKETGRIMPLLKKLIKLGSSRAVVIPSGWLDYYEQNLGHTIENVLMTVKGNNIIITIDEKEDLK